MKVSLITTVKNEADNIEEFLQTILKQTRRPDEFVIRDAGSIDGTTSIIKKYTKKYKWISLVIAPNTNIAQGRNLAIKRAKSEIIAVTDAGCRVDKNWLKSITKPFADNNVDIVSGVYKPLWKSEFQYYEGLVTCPDPKKLTTPSRMSSRSLAFRKRCWEAVGGYPERYDIGEDTFFNLKLIEKGFKFAFARNAVVYWEMRKTWKSLFKQFYRYGAWDRKSRNILKLRFSFLMTLGFWSLITASLLYGTRLFVLVLIFFAIDLFRTAPKIFRENKKIKTFVYCSAILAVRRLAYIIGVSLGAATKY